MIQLSGNSFIQCFEKKSNMSGLPRFEYISIGDYTYVGANGYSTPDYIRVFSIIIPI